MTTPTLPTVDETGPFQIVGCVFRPGDKRSYDYKIPASWEPKVGQRLKVKDSRGHDGAWKAVTIVELNRSLNPAIKNWAWGIELMEPEGDTTAAAPITAPFYLDDEPKPSIAARFQPTAYDSRNVNPGGALIGQALAADLAKPEPESLKDQMKAPEPVEPAPAKPVNPDVGEW